MSEIYYSTSEDGIFEEDPEQVALDYFNYDGYNGEIIQVYIGESYNPETQDEIDRAEMEGFTFLVRNVKPYAKYKYNLKNDSVVELIEDITTE